MTTPSWSGDRSAAAGAGHWAAIESTPGLQGGFIRESRERGILQRVSEARAAGRGDTGLYGDGSPVRMECFRHEGIVIANRQRLRGLDWLSAEWELSFADGGTLTAPAALPRLAPGESSAVHLPFALPEHGGEAWLTLRIRTADDEPWAPRGTEVSGPRVRLR